MKRILAYLTLTLIPALTFAREKGIDQKIDETFGGWTEGFVNFIFYSIPFTDEIKVPWVLFVLVGGAIFFTIYFKFINVRGFKTAINIVRGKYDDLEDGGHVEVSDTVHTVDGDEVDTIRIEGEHDGEVSHFQALTAALSATVGLGNIAGVAVALSIGGPGATFWMIIAGLIGMASKFAECTLGVKYREIDEQGRVFGGPMYYLKKGLANKGLAGLGKVLAVLFAIMCVGGSFGGGNMFQANQAFTMLEAVNQDSIPVGTDYSKIEGEKVKYSFVDSYKGDIVSFEDGTFVTKQGAEEREFEFDKYLEDSIPLFNKAGEEIYLREGDSGNDFVGGTIIEEYDTYVVGELKISNENNINLILSDGEEFPVSKEDLAVSGVISPLSGSGFWIGIILAVLVGVVIIGGIKSIAKVTDKIVPFMVGIYAIAAITVLVYHFDKIPAAFGEIFAGAFSPAGITGGVIGVLIQGFKRAAFSNEAGIGSASIAHSAVKTKNPASEGLVALLEPFIDTVVVCTMTALVLVITNMDGSVFKYGQEISGGVAYTSKAFASVISFFPYVLTVAVVLFAFSSMISWSYYGYQAWSFLFGKTDMVGYIYKFIFCLFVIVGSASQLDAVINFSDAMIFAMLVPNMIGLFFLAPKVREEYNKYMTKIKARKA